MILYIKPLEHRNILYKIFNVLRKETIESKKIISVPLNKKSKKWQIKRVANRLFKYLDKNVIKDIVLEETLMNNQVLKNILYSNNINILEGAKLSKFLTYNIVEKIYKYKNKNIQLGEITILVNEINNINQMNIIKIAEEVKRVNIITNNVYKFERIVEYLYDELGILIKLTSNKSINLNSTDIIINIDFPEELINRVNIPDKAIILNFTKNIRIRSKRFEGISIHSWQIRIPKEDKMEHFNDLTMYESKIYNMADAKIFEKIETDEVTIDRLIGINGIIDKKEFLSKIS